MNKLTETIFKLQGQARRLLEVTNTAITGLEIGESLKGITPDTAHAINNIAEETARLTLDSIPRPKGKDPTAELIEGLKEARELHTKRLTSEINGLSIVQDLLISRGAVINAACVIAHLTDKVQDARLKADNPSDALTQEEKESLNLAMQEILRTGKPFQRLVEGEPK